MTDKKNIKIWREQGKVLCQPVDSAEAFAVKIAWVRPMSGRGKEITIIDKDSHKELVMLDDLKGLDADSRKIVEEELDQRYLVASITRIIKIDVGFGNRYFEVETDRGICKFLVKNPNTGIVFITDDNVLIKDVMGNRYEIRSLAELDKASRLKLNLIV